MCEGCCFAWPWRAARLAGDGGGAERRDAAKSSRRANPAVGTYLRVFGKRDAAARSVGCAGEKLQNCGFLYLLYVSTMQQDTVDPRIFN